MNSSKHVLEGSIFRVRRTRFAEYFKKPFDLYLFSKDKFIRYNVDDSTEGVINDYFGGMGGRIAFFLVSIDDPRVKIVAEAFAIPPSVNRFKDSHVRAIQMKIIRGHNKKFCCVDSARLGCYCYSYTDSLSSLCTKAPEIKKVESFIRNADVGSTTKICDDLQLYCKECTKEEYEEALDREREELFRRSMNTIKFEWGGDGNGGNEGMSTVKFEWSLPGLVEEQKSIQQPNKKIVVFSSPQKTQFTGKSGLESYLDNPPDFSNLEKIKVEADPL